MTALKMSITALILLAGLSGTAQAQVQANPSNKGTRSVASISTNYGFVPGSVSYGESANNWGYSGYGAYGYPMGGYGYPAGGYGYPAGTSAVGTGAVGSFGAFGTPAAGSFGAFGTPAAGSFGAFGTPAFGTYSVGSYGLFYYY
jgi:hypothetical protein